MSDVTDVRLEKLSRIPTQDVREQGRYEYIVWPYRLALPFMYAIALYAHAKKKTFAFFGKKPPEINCWLGDGLTVNGRKVKDGATSWRALDTVYNFTEGEGPNIMARAFDSFYMHIRNAQAPRNRLKMAKEALRKAMIATWDDNGMQSAVQILSLAAGSAQGVIEVMVEMKNRGIPSEALLIDQDPTALTHARTLASLHGISDCLRTELGDVAYFKQMLGDFKPDIVEMMGLTDYLSDRMAVILFKKIRRCLKTGGYFFTSNVHPNSEQYFLRHVVNWDMIYRSKRELEDLFVDAGFLHPEVVSEPHGIQSFAFDRRQD